MKGTSKTGMSGHKTHKAAPGKLKPTRIGVSATPSGGPKKTDSKVHKATPVAKHAKVTKKKGVK